jgi:glutaredoxin 2
MESGVKYDNTEPVLENALFDLKKASVTHACNIIKQKRLLTELKSNIRSFYDFGFIKNPDIKNYHDALDNLSDILFDIFDYDPKHSPLVIEWKEYFHGLYDLVVIPNHHDKTLNKIMINELYKYYTVLKPPKEPNPPVEIVDRIQSLFRRLKDEHKKLLIPRFEKKLLRSFQYSKVRRLEHMKREEELKVLESTQTMYNKILEWTKG